MRPRPPVVSSVNSLTCAQLPDLVLHVFRVQGRSRDFPLGALSTHVHVCARTRVCVSVASLVLQGFLPLTPLGVVFLWILLPLDLPSSHIIILTPLSHLFIKGGTPRSQETRGPLLGSRTLTDKGKAKQMQKRYL